MFIYLNAHIGYRVKIIKDEQINSQVKMAV